MRLLLILIKMNGERLKALLQTRLHYKRALHL